MRARRVDDNYHDVIRELERLGLKVHRTNSDWDLTVAFGRAIELIEIKNPNTAYGKKGLNKRQKDLPIQPYLIRNLEDCLHCAQTLKLRNDLISSL